MVKDDYERVLEEMRLSNGIVWSLPVVLPVDKDVADEIKIGEEVTLVDDSGKIYAVMIVEDIYERNKERETIKIFQTRDEAHPGVKKVYESKPILLGGEIWLVSRIKYEKFNDYRFDPNRNKKDFQRKRMEDSGSVSNA